MEPNSLMELQTLSPSRLMDNVYAFENDVFSTEFQNSGDSDHHGQPEPLLGGNFASLELIPEFIKNAGRSGYKLCSTHSTEELRFYCRDCRVVTCNLCERQKHKKHDTILYTIALTEKYDNLLASLSQMKMLTESLTIAEGKVSARKEESEKVMQSVERQIKSHFDFLRSRLDHLQLQMTNKLTHLSADYFAKCAKTRADLASTRRSIEPFTNIIGDLHSRLQSEEDLFSLEESMRSQLITAKDDLTAMSTLRSLRFDLNWREAFEELLCEENIGLLSTREVNDICYPVRQFKAGNSNDKCPTCIESIAVLSNGNIAVVDVGNKKVKVLTPLGRSIFCFVGSGKFHADYPTQVAPLDAGRMLISDPGSGKLILFNANGTGLAVYQSLGCNALCPLGSSNTSSSLLDEWDGGKLVINQRRISVESTASSDIKKSPSITSNDRERLCSSARSYQSFDSAPSDNTSYPVDILVCNTQQKTLKVVCVEGSSISTKRSSTLPANCLYDAGSCDDPRHIAVNPVSGHIFVTSTSDICLCVFSAADGSLLHTYGQKDGLGSPGDLVIDRDGRILLADTLNHRVHVLDPQGHFHHFLAFELADGEGLNSSGDSKSTRTKSTTKATGVCGGAGRPDGFTNLLLDRVIGVPRLTYVITRPFILAMDASCQTLWIAEREGLVKQFTYLS